MRYIASSFLIGNLVWGGMVLPAEAGGSHPKHHPHHYSHHVYLHDHSYAPGHFVGGFLAGAATVLVVNALRTPRVVYTRPVVYRSPVCQNIWAPGQWELRPRQDNGFTTYYQVWVEGHWQQQCG